MDPREKVLIFVVAYNAGSHIRSVLDRLPREVFDPARFHILIIDDCSGDETAKAASSHVAESGFQNVTVLRNTINQGYGGNQKIGYRYAIENGFGFVILLHGDGQYAPELVLEFVKRWRGDLVSGRRPEVVLGSRMIDKARARAGGMPLYKWIGNQILTRIQNTLIGTDLSEFHTGYRAYDVEFLSRVPFELNTNDFHFDTEILLQAAACRGRMVEFSIPTHYGDEICHVNGMKYAKDVVLSSLAFRFQRIGFFCSMKYKGLFRIERLRRYAKAVGLAEHVAPGSLVLSYGAVPESWEAKLAEKGCVVRRVAGDGSVQDVSAYAWVLGFDLIETLSDAERFLVESRYRMSAMKEPRFLFTFGNVAFLGLRVLLGSGVFNYGENGILRESNKRLFTQRSFLRMLSETGFQADQVQGVGIPFELVFRGGFGRMLARMSSVAARIWPSMFAYSYIVVATPKPHSLMLLREAQRFFEPGAKPTLDR